MFSEFGEKHKITNLHSSVNHKLENYNENHTHTHCSQTDKKPKQKILKASRKIILHMRAII